MPTKKLNSDVVEMFETQPIEQTGDITFRQFNAAVQNQFAEMQKGKLFKINVPKDLLWLTYIESFPKGSNPIFRVRTEHDCNIDRGFVKNAGSIVSIKDGKIQTLWDINVGGSYQVVADKLAELVRNAEISDVLLTAEPRFGKAVTHSPLAGGGIETFYHFEIIVPKDYIESNKDKIATKLGETRTAKEVFLRGLNTITKSSLETALELIDQKSVYRLEEHSYLITEFLKVKAKFDKIKTEREKELFAWEKVSTVNGAVAFIRNSVVGTFLLDLSEGVELEDAVKKYETKVAPTNYKRPIAVVSKQQIQKAQETVQELGYTSALQRRYANIHDITINNVLFADRTAKRAMNVFDELSASAVVANQKLDKIEEITIEDFINKIVAKAESIEVLFENSHVGNLVSLIAPVDPEAKHMFKWDNAFSWSYNGGIADSMKERVAAAGGRVNGVLRFTHSWNHPEVGRNASLMDLHVFLPGSTPPADGIHNSYGNDQRVGWNHRNHYASGGSQDVDYTSRAPENYIPIENIAFPSMSKLKEGKYIFKIHNWDARHPNESGFKAEIEFGGQIFQYNHPKPLKHHQWITLAEVTLKNSVFTIEHKLESKATSQKKWGIDTETYRKVDAIMFSPNYWDNKQVGNKHYFFMLDGCKNEGTARGFYNEFLSAELDKHRKVLEMVGAKMKTEESEHQLSGIGFSSTQHNHLIAKVKGSFTRTLKIVF